MEIPKGIDWHVELRWSHEDNCGFVMIIRIVVVVADLPVVVACCRRLCDSRKMLKPKGNIIFFSHFICYKPTLINFPSPQDQFRLLYFFTLPRSPFHLFSSLSDPQSPKSLLIHTIIILFSFSPPIYLLNFL